MDQMQNEEVKRITEELETGIMDLFASNRYQEYLDVMAKFHTYSLNNSFLIAMQKPDATMVAGYQAWKRNFNRYVRKGEQGIEILAPTPYVVEKEQDKIDPVTKQPVLGRDGTPIRETIKVTVPAFKPVKVFDISQTEGEELPTIATALTGDVADYQMMLRSIERMSPVPIEFGAIEGTANGYYAPMDQKIVIRSGMSEAQTIKTLIHEISHAKLHGKKDDGKDTSTQEVEAESIAYTVCKHYGLDASEYSFGYVAGWSADKDLKQLKASMNTIRSTASEIITEIDTEHKQMIEEAKPYKVTFYATTHAGYLSKEDYYEFGSILDAIQKFEELRQKAGKDQAEVGFNFHDKVDPMYDVYGTFLFNGKLNDGFIQEVDKFLSCPEIQEALRILSHRYDRELHPKENIDHQQPGRDRSNRRYSNYHGDDDRSAGTDRPTYTKGTREWSSGYSSRSSSGSSYSKGTYKKNTSGYRSR